MRTSYYLKVSGVVAMISPVQKLLMQFFIVWKEENHLHIRQIFRLRFPINYFLFILIKNKIVKKVLNCIKKSKEVKKLKEKPKEKPTYEPKKHNKEKEDKEKAPPKTVLSIEEVSKIALQQFSGEIDEIELDEENGRLIYEIEIERGEQEAEIEIDAYTGEIIVIEIEED